MGLSSQADKQAIPGKNKKRDGAVRPLRPQDGRRPNEMLLAERAAKMAIQASDAVASSSGSDEAPSLPSVLAPTAMTENGLCQDCATIDLEPLLRTDFHTNSSRSVAELSAQQRVYLDRFMLSQTTVNTQCSLCALVVQCGHMAGLDMDADNHQTRWRDELETRVMLGCSLRPKLSWSVGNRHGDVVSPPRVVHDGLIIIEFHYATGDFKANIEVIGLRARANRIQSDMDKNAKEETEGYRTKSQRRTRKEVQRQLAADLERITKMIDGLKAKVNVRNPHASWEVGILDLWTGNSLSPRRLVDERVNMSLLCTWIQACQFEHHHPIRKSGTFDASSQLSLGDYMKAINTTTGEVKPISLNEKFTALSYVWGTDPSIETNTPRLPGLTSYPPTIRDAAILSRTLGFEWLWVDRICIDQTDDAEKEILIPYMKDIFGAAELSIVAANSRNAQTGMLGISSSLRSREQAFRISSAGAFIHLLPTPSSFNVMYEKSVWRTRGWTFQEAAFSRRLLYIFEDEIFFSCARGTCRESTGAVFSTDVVGSTWADNGRTPPTIVGQLHAKIHYADVATRVDITCRDLVRALEEYSARDLTFEEDRIQAFAGIILAASSNFDTESDTSLLLHGHPPNFFESLLTWHCDVENATTKSKPTSQFIPSWSWAAAGSKVEFLDNGEEHKKNCWFLYERLPGIDILGVPWEEDIPIITNVCPSFPTHIITSMPWMSWLENKPQLPQSHQLPILHLVTVVFEATISQLRRAHPASLYQHTRGQHHLLDREIPRHFALIGGYSHMYLMVLASGVDEHTFSRLAVVRLTLYDLAITSVMRRGNAQWRYIRLT